MTRASRPCLTVRQFKLPPHPESVYESFSSVSSVKSVAGFFFSSYLFVLFVPAFEAFGFLIGASFAGRGPRRAAPAIGM